LLSQCDTPNQMNVPEWVLYGHKWERRGAFGQG
jgi:hypothetical protein